MQRKLMTANPRNDSAETYPSDNSFPVGLYNSIRRPTVLRESQYQRVQPQEVIVEQQANGAPYNRFLIEKIYEEDFPEESKRRDTTVNDLVSTKYLKNTGRNTQEKSTENSFMTKDQVIRAIYIPGVKKRFRNTIKSSISNQEVNPVSDMKLLASRLKKQEQQKQVQAAKAKFSKMLVKRKASQTTRDRYQQTSFKLKDNACPQVDLSLALNSMPRNTLKADYPTDFPRLMNSQRQRSQYNNQEQQVYEPIERRPNQSVRQMIDQGQSGVKTLIKEFQPHSLMFDDIDMSEFKIKKYKNGVYFGEMSQGDKKHGVGVLFYQNGRLYQGSFSDDLKQGKGYQLYADGSFYDGEYSQGFKSGKGRFVWINGEIYFGEWLSGKRNGSGMWNASRDSRQSYIGQWFNGKPHGLGVYFSQIGDKYQGEFRNGLKQGHGIQKYISGDKYDGTFLKGRRHGYGQFTYSNGDLYQGHFYNNLKHGSGKYIQFQGKQVYEGTYKNDNISGEGQYLFSDGTMYEGSFQNNLIHGQGKVTYTDNRMYKGYWLNGLKIDDVEAVGAKGTKQFRSIQKGRMKRLAVSMASGQILIDGLKREREVVRKSRKQFKVTSLDSDKLKSHKKLCGCLGHRRRYS